MSIVLKVRFLCIAGYSVVLCSWLLFYYFHASGVLQHQERAEILEERRPLSRMAICEETFFLAYPGFVIKWSPTIQSNLVLEPAFLLVYTKNCSKTPSWPAYTMNSLKQKYFETARFVKKTLLTIGWRKIRFSYWCFLLSWRSHQDNPSGDSQILPCKDNGTNAIL